MKTSWRQHDWCACSVSVLRLLGTVALPGVGCAAQAGLLLVWGTVDQDEEIILWKERSTGRR